MAPADCGILAVELYLPRRFVDQSELELYDGVSAGKYTVGLGQLRMAFVDDREDAVSMALSAVRALLDATAVPTAAIGRIDVGTESQVDKSKSIKTHLMQLFPDNPAIEGVDSVNACYGGVAALFNAIQWMQSDFWDGRNAIVVATDVAVYAPGAARPTGGAGAAAILVGPNAPIVIESKLLGTHMENVWDFYKPDLRSEYAQVDGKLTVTCYLRSLDSCYRQYLERLAIHEPDTPKDTSAFDYLIFHAPYAKLVQKSFARLHYVDFLNDPTKSTFTELLPYQDVSLQDSYVHRELERKLMSLSESNYRTRVLPSLLVSRNVGNSYCATIFMCLASLIHSIQDADLVGKRIGMFSYGSGSAASLFSLRIREPLTAIRQYLNLTERLDSRVKCTPQEFSAALEAREAACASNELCPAIDPSCTDIAPGAYYLVQVDARGRRHYTLVE